jgi:H+/Cl- antiporter ClcA
MTVVPGLLELSSNKPDVLAVAFFYCVSNSEMKQQLNKQPNVFGDPVAAFPLRFWICLVITGAGAGLAGGLLMRLLHAVQHFTWSYHAGTFLDAVQHSTAVYRVIALLVAGLMVAAFRLSLRNAGGGHGGEISEAIWFREGHTPPLRAAATAVVSIVAVGIGASMGREGSLKQAGAAIGSWFGSKLALPPGQRRLLVACGAGAGVAAAYNVPFGGAMFAVEVLLGGIALPLVAPAVAASSIGVFVSWALLPNQPTYTVGEYGFSGSLMAWAIVAAPFLAVASIGYVRLIAWADARKPKGLLVVIAPVVALTLVGVLAIKWPQILGNGKDVVQLSFGNQLGLPLLLILPLLKPLATAVCLGSGTPGGLFTPTLTFGALLGALFGYGWSYFWPGSPLASYSMVGAAAVLAVSMQGPVSAIILLIELTRQLTPVMVPVAAAVAVAMLVGRAIDSKSIYSARIHEGKSATKARTPSSVTNFNASWIREDFGTISVAARYPEVAARLIALNQQGRLLYAIDETGRVVGEIKESAAAEDNRSISVPLEMAIAGDVVTEVPMLDSSMTATEIIKELRDSKAERLPVVDRSSGKLIGTVASDLVLAGALTNEKR